MFMEAREVHDHYKALKSAQVTCIFTERVFVDLAVNWAQCAASNMVEIHYGQLKISIAKIARVACHSEQTGCLEYDKYTIPSHAELFPKRLATFVDVACYRSEDHQRRRPLECVKERSENR